MSHKIFLPQIFPTSEFKFLPLLTTHAIINFYNESKQDEHTQKKLAYYNSGNASLEFEF